jgi:peptidoglycan/xylan/chitin deacetylase (PgdA/CDA1 family)
MDRKIQNILLSIARPVKLNRLIGWSDQQTLFPFYHTVAPRPLPHISHLYRVLTPAEFEKDLDQLLKWFEPVSLGDYLDQAGTKPGKPCMVLTFDDGLSGCHRYIAPLLKKKGVPASFFLNNRFIDNRSLFYRYKASLLVHQVKKDCRSRELVAEFLKIRGDQVEASIMLAGYDQRKLLDALTREVGLDITSYLTSSQVYMNGNEIEELMEWGFDMGGHSADHIDFRTLEPGEMVRQVRLSLEDLQQRFGIKTGYFSFPFTSDGIPEKVIKSLLEEETVKVLLGSAGLKRTGKHAFIQRVPMEPPGIPAGDLLKAEYFYYLLKGIVGRNRLRY